MYSNSKSGIKLIINSNPKMENYGYMYAYIIVEPIYSHWLCVPNFKLTSLKQTTWSYMLHNSHIIKNFIETKLNLFMLLITTFDNSTCKLWTRKLAWAYKFENTSLGFCSFNAFFNLLFWGNVGVLSSCNHDYQIT